ncbi:MAG TPA: sugar transferase [Flavisolibacter sp.]|nr:sugar transferase [Flavisolibacter sp.]
MQVEILSSVPEVDKKRYLRVAAISSEKNGLSFLYIGTDYRPFHILSNSFYSGYSAENFTEAKKLIQSQSFINQNIDVIIVDVSYDAKEFKNFQSFLKTTDAIHYTTPVIYNECHLLNKGIELKPDMIDDIIDLSNWQFDLNKKISFLKKSKEYIPASSANSPKIKSGFCFYKRVFDVVLSSLLLLILLPVLVLIAIAIKLESKGPVFYNAKRAGRGFKIFRFYKFRTMVINADKKIEALAHLNQYRDNLTGPKFFKISNDPRVTKIGKFLRNTSLDELPQLFNVLKGDMSLVGNRPLPLYEAATLTTNEFVERFMAPAGITGLWQIKKRGREEMSIDERISLDISYARKSNLIYDFWIMANTPKALLQKSNA